jgi:hypothetical protein
MTWLQRTIGIEPGDVAKTIINVVRNERDHNSRPTSLAALGVALRRHYGRPFKVLSTEPSLASFISRHLATKVELIRDENHPLVLYAALKSDADATSVRNTEAGQTDKQEEEVRVTGSEEKADTGHPRYDFRFWAAFAKPIIANTRRFLKTSWPVKFYDVPDGTAPPPGLLEIEANYIAPADLPPGSARAKHVAQQISAWLEQHDLESGQFEFKGSESDRMRPKATVPVIVQLLSNLEPKDLEKLVFPADVWLKLLGMK